MRNLSMKKVIALIISLLTAAQLSACGSGTDRPTADEILYSNLASAPVQQQMAEILTSADISKARQQVFFDHVNQFNSIMDTGHLALDFEKLTAESKYDPYEMQDKWNAASPDFMGYNCRITALGLMGDFIQASADSETREDMIMMDLVALEEDATGLIGEHDISVFKALYSTVPTTMSKDINIHVQNLQADWNARGIRFPEHPNASLICVVFHESIDEHDNYLFIGHTGVLLAHQEKLYFIEKIAFQEPYQLTVFSTREQLNDYLMGKYDTAFDQPTAAPFIMENDQLLDGYRRLRED